MFALELRAVTKKFGPLYAMADVTLGIKQGEFVSFLGPSGSGKTTTLRTIAGLTPPDSGEIYIDGKLANKTPEHKRNLGMVFQNYALFPHMTVFENVAF